MKKAKRKSVLPDFVPLYGGSYRVVEVADLIDSDESFGKCDYRRRVLRIDASLADDTKHITLEHEKVHAILFDAEIKLTKKVEEAICEAIARHRVFEMNHHE